jgi:hypothetical protein
MRPDQTPIGARNSIAVPLIARTQSVSPVQIIGQIGICISGAIVILSIGAEICVCHVETRMMA